MTDEEEWEAEDRESIYLTHAERQVFQKQLNEIWRQMLDNAVLASPPFTTGGRIEER